MEKFRNKISKPLPRELLKMEVYDSSLPPDEQRTMTFEEMIREKFKEIDAANQVPKMKWRGFGKNIKELTQLPMLLGQRKSAKLDY